PNILVACVYLALLLVGYLRDDEGDVLLAGLVPRSRSDEVDGIGEDQGYVVGAPVGVRDGLLSRLGRRVRVRGLDLVPLVMGVALRGRSEDLVGGHLEENLRL